MNPTYWPYIAIGLALLSLFARESSATILETERKPLGSFLALASVCVILVLAAWKWQSIPEALPAAVGFSMGALLVAVCSALSGSGLRDAWRVAPLGLATALVASSSWFGSPAPLCLVFGSAVAA